MLKKDNLIKPTKLLPQFTVKGYYYHVGKSYRRRYLDIKKKDGVSKTHDLMVIMMNPGSSEAVDQTVDYLNKLVPALPDTTQYQVMRFMIETELSYARILNLSDIIQTKSKDFYKQILTDSEMNTHSIFCVSNRTELKKLFVPNIPILLAWGVNDKLSPIAVPAKEYVSKWQNKCFGYQKAGSPAKFYHPLRPDSNYLAEWINECVESYKNMH